MAAHVRMQGRNIVLYVPASNEFVAKSRDEKQRILDSWDNAWGALVVERGVVSSTDCACVVFHGAGGKVICGTSEEKPSRLFIER